ncbi:MAG: anti-sigma factor, partial [Pricia sp.]|nr:anti-sigma factor [Pricia sp.]
MEVDKYIASGILELYVAGALTEEENMEVFQYAREYPEIHQEILAIEAAVLDLTKSVAPRVTNRQGFDDVKVRIGERKE